MDDSDLETLRKLLDDYSDASRQVTDRFRSVEDRLAALHRQRRVEDQIAQRFAPPD